MNGGREKLLVDAGPIVALYNGSDQFHSWAIEAFGQIRPPVHTCEAVLSEAMLLLENRGADPRVPLEMVKRGFLVLDFQVDAEVDRLRALLRSYADVPMSLADACLVRMSEKTRRARVMTTDSDFLVYRRNRRQVIPVLTPPGVEGTM